MTGGTKKRILGIGLDGVPHSLAQKYMDEGLMPNLRKLASESTFKRINSTYPPMSNVAWSAFQTGLNPGEFGVYGFVEVTPDLQLYTPRRNDLKAKTIWEMLHEAGKTVVALSLPHTWPALKVRGVFVSGFLCPELDERAVNSPATLEKLRKLGYIVDLAPDVVRPSLEEFSAYLLDIAMRRQKTALALLESEKWDYFFVHVMDTDRVNHYVWSYQHDPSSPHYKFFRDFYARIDTFVGQIRERMPKDAELVILSDHGFCDMTWEVQLNRWLRDKGYLDYENAPDKHYQAVKPGSRALALVPGRIHLLTKAKWRKGTVSESDYGPLRDEIIAQLKEMKDPNTGTLMCKKVLTRDELYSGPCFNRAHDIIIDPVEGYDFKAVLGDGPLLDKPTLKGMHTYWDAMLFVTPGLPEIAACADITEVGAQVIRHYMG